MPRPKVKKAKLTGSGKWVPKWLRIFLAVSGGMAAVVTIIGFIQSELRKDSSLPELPEDAKSAIQYVTFPVHLSANTTFGFSIYLRESQKLHFTWWVREGGGVTVGLVTPGGGFFGFCEESGRLEKDRRILLRDGSTTFRPRENGWGTGYYEVRMTAYSEVSELELRYWIEK